MSLKIQLSQVTKSSTQEQSQVGSSSFTVSKKRQMFQQINDRQLQVKDQSFIHEQNGTKLIPKNVLMLTPGHIRSATWPQVFMPDQQIYVTLNGNFYSIKDRRNKKIFINRNSKPNAELVHFNVGKHREKLVISSVQKFVLKSQVQTHELWYHFNVAIFNLEGGMTQRFSCIEKGFVHVSQNKTGQNPYTKTHKYYYLEFKGIQLINNFKKAIVVFEPISIQSSRYEVVMIDFLKGSAPNSSESIQGLSQSSLSKKVGTAHLERKVTEDYIKMINSEYGDVVFLVTSDQIYEVQMTGLKHKLHSLVLKPIVIYKILSENKNTYIQNQASQPVLSRHIYSRQETIFDSQYILNGLKVMVLTSYGRIFTIQSQQCLFSESLYEVLSLKQIVQSYNIDNFVFKKIYLLKGLLVVEVQAEKKQDCNLLRQTKHEWSILDKLDENNNIEYVSRGLLVAKVQNNSLSFSKFISLPFGLKEYEFFKVHTFTEADELLLQTINQKDLEILQLHKCQILSNKNSFIAFSKENYVKYPKIEISAIQSGKKPVKQAQQVQQNGQLKIAFGKSNKSLYILKGNEVQGYRIYTNELSSSVPKGIERTLSMTFFQKPQKLIINPLTGYVIILFREFIKIFINSYNELRLIYIMSVRNALDISFSKYGQRILLCMNDNSIYLVDSYTFNQNKIMDFHGDVKQAQHVSDYILSVKNTKNILTIFKKKQFPMLLNSGKGRSQFLEYYDKVYEVKLQSDDLYQVDQNNTIVLKRGGFVQFYSHITEDRTVSIGADYKQVIVKGILSKEHPHLVNKKMSSLQKGQRPTYLFYSSQFSTLFIGTSSGNMRQYLYPFLSIQDPSHPQCYTFPLSNNSILHIEINADFSSLYAITQLNEMVQVQFSQFLNGHKRNAIYTLSKTQVDQQKLRYQFANRSYLIDDFTTITKDVNDVILEEYDEVCFIDEKIKDDIDDISGKIKYQSNREYQNHNVEKKDTQSRFEEDFVKISVKAKSEHLGVNQKLRKLAEVDKINKQQLIQKYQGQLLQIYKENDRLKGIRMSRQSQMQGQVSVLKEQFQRVTEQQRLARQIQTKKLQQQYQELSNKYDRYKNATLSQVQQNKVQLEVMRSIQITQVQNQLREEELRNQAELSRNSKIEKQIERFRKRGIYFENVIVETRNQIQQLDNDVALYDHKKAALNKELGEKEVLIQDKQKIIVRFLKNTNEMKKVKNVHEFELKQFEGEMFPIQQKIKDLEKQVQKMNFEIMEQFNSKFEQNQVISSSQKRIQKLKIKNKQAVEKLLKIRTVQLRFTQSLESILVDPFNLGNREKLNDVINKFSKKNQVFVPNEEIEKAKKQGQKFMRRKNILQKAIEQERKLQDGIVKNKNQFFKYYADNTNVVKEYNQLFKDHNILLQQKRSIQDKIACLKTQMNRTPIKLRSASLNVRKSSQKKLTPFQRYEQEQLQFNTLKIKDTVQTRASRGQKSTTFLTSLIKVISGAEESYDKATLVRERIRTFVNPEAQRKKEIQKELFRRERGKSNYSPLLKL